MVSDLRVIIVKLADRLHNMQTLNYHPDPAKRERIALETLNIYAPIADRLGIFEFKEALETECFRILYPVEFDRITKELASLREQQDFFIHKARELIRGVINPDVPIIDISYRIKAPFSIYRKLSRKDYSYTHTGDLYDLFAIRIITDDIRHCYEILGVLHNIFVPMPNRFKDYIALPKEN
jgi:guanosine-3',5'-bis(diphosphate) 3'-pyrophosphohydrolase